MTTATCLALRAQHATPALGHCKHGTLHLKWGPITIMHCVETFPNSSINLATGKAYPKSEKVFKDLLHEIFIEIRRKMPENAKVIVKFGPYRSCGTVEHRTSRLEGLQVLLKENGHTVDLEPSEDWHDVEIIVNGETVYRCDIRNLEFGGDGKLDKLCHEALEAVNKAF